MKFHITAVLGPSEHSSPPSAAQSPISVLTGFSFVKIQDNNRYGRTYQASDCRSFGYPTSSPPHRSLYSLDSKAQDYNFMANRVWWP